MVRGLKTLHDRNILHRDLKSANVFLCRDGSFKLGDMNVSKLAAQDGMLFTQTGTPYYASPEVWRDQPYDNRSDLWSLGCVLYEMTALNPPFKAANMDALFKVVISANYPAIPNYYSKDLSRMVTMLLQADPRNRPSCDEILQMALVQQNYASAGFDDQLLNQSASVSD